MEQKYYDTQNVSKIIRLLDDTFRKLLSVEKTFDDRVSDIRLSYRRYAFTFFRNATPASKNTDMQITAIASDCQAVMGWRRKMIARNAAMTGLRKKR